MAEPVCLCEVAVVEAAVLGLDKGQGTGRQVFVGWRGQAGCSWYLALL